MKYLSDYTQDGITRILEQYEAFWAFGSKQFQEKCTEGVKYVQLSNGLICPKEHAKAAVKELIENGEKAVKQDIAENGIKNIIIRELANHECYYTCDPTQAIEALEIYKEITADEVVQVYREQRKFQAEQ